MAAKVRKSQTTHIKSPSSAGSAVMGGKACNGWRFWSLEQEAGVRLGKPKKERKPGKAGKRPRKATGFERLEDGRRFCNPCMAAFDVADDKDPEECPHGHKAYSAQGAEVL